MKPKFIFADSNSVAWEKHQQVSGVEIKQLLGASGQVMELYKFLPNIIFPDHLHNAPEFLYLLEGSAKVDGKWITSGWASVAETGTMETNFQSGDTGCVFMAVYTIGTNNIGTNSI